MTRGTVLVIGPTGRNFAAGMTGGIAYVLDESGDFRSLYCNRADVDLDPLDTEDIALIHGLVQRHRTLTGSPRAQQILDRWDSILPRFIKVFPQVYKRALCKAADASRNERQSVHG